MKDQNKEVRHIRYPIFRAVAGFTGGTALGKGVIWSSERGDASIGLVLVADDPAIVAFADLVPLRSGEVFWLDWVG